MDISLRTVKSHASHIYSKLSVRNKMELFRLLESFHLISQQAAGSTPLFGYFIRSP